MGPDTSQARHFCSDPGYIFFNIVTFALEFDAHNRMFFRILTVGVPSYLFFVFLILIFFSISLVQINLRSIHKFLWFDTVVYMFKNEKEKKTLRCIRI